MISAVNFVRKVELEKLKSEEIEKFYQIAKLNRIGYFLLHKAIDQGLNLPTHLHKIFRKENIRYKKILKEFTQVSQTLDKLGIGFAIFKSLKPFPSTTVDIDIIIFNNYWKAVTGLISKNYKILGWGPESITLQDPYSIVGIDLYREVSVSRLRYFSKNKLHKYVEWVNTELGDVKNLKLECDLICVAAHSFIKEQMFTLADYFYFTKYLNKCNLNLLLNIAVETCSEIPLTIILRLVNVIHKKVYGKKLCQIKLDTWEARFEEKRFKQKNFKVPFKYHPLTILNGILKLLKKEENSRKSLTYQINYLLRLKNTKPFLKDLLSHIKRKTY